MHIPHGEIHSHIILFNSMLSSTLSLLSNVEELPLDNDLLPPPQMPLMPLMPLILLLQMPLLLLLLLLLRRLLPALFPRRRHHRRHSHRQNLFHHLNHRRLK